MPKYVLNGKTYNIPDNLTQKFESENPNATVAYTAGGKHYNIPVSKREKFLKAFPDASTGEQSKKAEAQEQKPAQPPTQAEALGEAILMTLQDSGATCKRVQAALRNTEKFRTESRAREMLQAYQSVL